MRISDWSSDVCSSDLQLRQRAEKDLVSVFILPPSTRDLEKRLHTRAQDSAEVVARRMAKAADEISHWAEYDYIVKIGRAHVLTPVTNAHLVCRLLLEKKKKKQDRNRHHKRQTHTQPNSTKNI